MVDDYHLTPMDYYCHEPVDLGKNTLEIPFFEGKDRILASTVSHKIEAPILTSFSDDGNDEEIPSMKEEPQKETGYTQISIFDDDDDYN